jgi:RHS repeat-associated protein
VAAKSCLSEVQKLSAKAGAVSDLISVPKGGGAVKGLGEKFSADLHTGTGNFSVPIALPPGRNGFQPQLTLSFSTGSSNGPFGLGWSLGIPGVSRLSSKGIPRYRDLAPAFERDTFVLSGAEDLVEIEEGTDGTFAYRPRTEGLFAKITRLFSSVVGSETDHWDVRTKDGLISIYGTPNQSAAEGGPDSRAVVADPENRRKVFAWRLTETRDPFGNRIAYDYVRDRGEDPGRTWDQIYLRRIRYVDLVGPDQAEFLVSVEFLYDDDGDPPGTSPEFSRQSRPDPFSEYRAGFEIRTRRRCNWIVVRTHPTKDSATSVRAYEFVYLDETTSDPAILPLNCVSLLRRINVIGYDDAGNAHRELPPLDFDYSRFSPDARKFVALEGRSLPATSLANPQMELIDLFGHGLPDFVELGGAVRYWRNLGAGRFDMPRLFADVPTSWNLSDAGVQLLDANGDGRADLVLSTGELAGYYPLDFRGEFSRKSFQRYRQAPSFTLEDPEVRLIDLTGDGITDVLRSGTAFECYFNEAKDGWLPQNTTRVQRQQLDAFPNVEFSDPRVKLADMSGDGLQDIAIVYEGRVDYWPNLGYGRWGNRITMALSSRLPSNFDPQRVLLGDVDGDGLADLVYVSDREVTLWINHTGNGWSHPTTVRGTPSVDSMVTVRLSDLLGTGVLGVLWTRDADGTGRPQHFFLDFTDGLKPYLLDRIDNNLGAVTEVTYSASTKFYLRDAASPATRWRTTLPFPVQVVERVAVKDTFSGGTLTTEYRYHHGYWDGVEREFRGFGMVEQIDTEVFDGYTGRGLSADNGFFQSLLQQETFSPPIMTRTWFHQGPLDPADDGHWYEVDWSSEYWPGDPNLLAHPESVNTFLATLSPLSRRDALRTLRGHVLRSEVYALDGSVLQASPYTVTEHAYNLREESPPTGAERERIFFPHATALRTTQWERGDDPMMQLSYISGYDDVGQPTRQLNIACPRGWRALSDAPPEGFLATLVHTVYAGTSPGGLYIRDRVFRARSFEITGSTGKTAAQLSATDETSPDLRLTAESVNFYDATNDGATGYGSFLGMPAGQLGAFGSLVRTESLVMTAEQITAAYGSTPPLYLVPGGLFQPNADYPANFVTSLPTLAGYIYRQGSVSNSEGYFAVTASKRFDFHTASGTGRGLMLAQRDPLGHESSVVYDRFDLLPVSVSNAARLATTASYNLRTFQPYEVTDQNGNITRLGYSPSGLVTDAWLLGKPSVGATDRRNAGDQTQASTHIEYDLLAYLRSRASASPQPVFARAVRRVFHDSDPDDTGETIEAREYSDGFGRLLQTRTQGEEVRFGNEPFGGGDSFLPVSQDASLPTIVTGTMNSDSTKPNVTVSGWQRYDNKGQVVEKFEPFWSTGWEYAPPTDAERGQKIAMFYDPRGQVVRTVNPDGSEQRVIHGIPNNLDDPPLVPTDAATFKPNPWEAYTYDANDNAGRTPLADPNAAKYRHHWNTPTSIEVDALGRTVRAVARYREAPVSPTSALPPIEEHITRSTYDIQGNLTDIHDPLGRLAFQYTYDLMKRVLRTESIDAGQRRMVFDAGGNLVEARDAKGAIGVHAYDLLNRPVRLWARDSLSDAVTLRERIVYGDSSDVPGTVAEKQLDNLLGKPWRYYDEAGIVGTSSYDFKANALTTSRQVLSDDFMLSDFRQQTGSDWLLHAPRVDWDATVLPGLDPYVYETRSAFDALGRVKFSDYPVCANGERYRLTPSFNRAGSLQSVALLGPLDTNDQGPSQTYLERIAYSAKGQRLLITYGNGLMTRYAYDAKTFRLARMRTERYVSAGIAAYKTDGQLLQDLGYFYDLAGNIVSIVDLTPGSGIVNNPTTLLADPALQPLLIAGDALLRQFEYDPLYRLVSATGRECADIPQPRPWSDDARCGYNSGNHGTPNQDNAPNLCAFYSEQYEYDPAGNMTALRHGDAASAKWARSFGMSGFTPSEWQQRLFAWKSGGAVDWGASGNRLTNVGDGNENVSVNHAYDANGNMVSEQTERHFEWDHADRMKVFRNQVDTRKPTIYALYLYDSGGQRVKKLVVNGSGYRTTTYVGSSFEHHKEVRLTATVENCSLHVMDDKSRIAITRVGLAFADDGAAEHPVQYHLGDHLGSSGIVVSRDGTWINREEYFPYGETSFGSFERKRYRFTSKERDEESGLVYILARYYSTCLCIWTTCDRQPAMSFPSLYVYAALSPVRYFDPDGRFERDFHFGVISYLARAAGISGKVADTIASYSQFVDDNKATEPVRSRLINGSKSEDISSGVTERDVAIRRFFHFPGSSPTKGVSRNDASARARVEDSIGAWKNAQLAPGPAKTNALMRLGANLHTLADTWPHEGFTADPSAEINTRTKRIPEFSRAGHADAAEEGHAPDKPYNDVDRAIEAAKVIYDLLGQMGNGKATPWEQLEPELRKAFSAKESDPKKREDAILDMVQKRFGDKPTYDLDNLSSYRPMFDRQMEDLRTSSNAK